MIFDFFKKPVGWAVMAVLLLIAMWWAYSALTRDARTEARLGKNQAEAAQESGSDAVNTIGRAGERENASGDLDKTNATEIHDAEGADQAVSGGVRDAGLASLCRRAAYRNDPKCMQPVNP